MSSTLNNSSTLNISSNFITYKHQIEDLLREAYLLAQCLAQGVSAATVERLLPKRFKQYAKGISQKA